MAGSSKSNAIRIIPVPMSAAAAQCKSINNDFSNSAGATETGTLSRTQIARRSKSATSAQMISASSSARTDDWQLSATFLFTQSTWYATPTLLSRNRSSNASGGKLDND